MRGREAIVVRPRNIAGESHKFFKIEKGASIEGRFKPDVSGNLPMVFALVNMLKTL
jgi:hypothetical protein